MTHPHRKMVRIDTKEQTLLIRKMAVQAVDVEQKPDGDWWVIVHTGEKGLGPFAMTVGSRNEADAILALFEEETPDTATEDHPGDTTPTFSPREGTAGEEEGGWQTEAYEDWRRANEIIANALAEWFGAARVEGGGHGSAIQARLAQAKPSLMVVRSSRINYGEKSCG
jgi:hypothetical protein